MLLFYPIHILQMPWLLPSASAKSLVLRDLIRVVNLAVIDPATSVGRGPEPLSIGSVAPNPFNPSTEIKFAVNRDNLVQLNVYNIRGEKVRTLVQDNLPMNEYTFVWDGKTDNGQTVSSGHYFARLRIGAEVTQVRKMALIK